jgi:hypothetical protein
MNRLRTTLAVLVTAAAGLCLPALLSDTVSDGFGATAMAAPQSTGTYCQACRLTKQPVDLLETVTVTPFPGTPFRKWKLLYSDEIEVWGHDN